MAILSQFLRFRIYLYKVSSVIFKTIPNIELIEISRLISARKVTCHWLEDRALTL